MCAYVRDPFCVCVWGGISQIPVFYIEGIVIIFGLPVTMNSTYS
jgi:hypothetical protein